MSKINIKESLLNIDKSNYCKYDLTTLYECCSLDQKDKEKLVLMLYKECSAEELYDFLYQHFLNDAFDIDENPVDELISDDYFPYSVSDFIQDGEEIKIEYQNPFFETYNISAGKIGAEDTIKFLNNILNNPKYKLTDKAKEKIYKNSAPWGLTVKYTPTADIEGTNDLLATGDFSSEASFGESNEVEQVDKTDIEVMEYCPNCGSSRFNSKIGLCIDCGYDEKDWGYTDTDDYDESIAPYKKRELKKQLQDELYNAAIKELIENPKWGFEDLRDIDEYIGLIIEVRDYEGEYDNDFVAEIRGEFTYDELFELGIFLNKIISKYDKYAYFEPVTSGITRAYLKLEENLTEGYTDYPEVDFSFTNKRINGLPGITNERELARKFDAVGLDKFKIKLYKLNNVSLADIKDTFGGSYFKRHYRWTAFTDGNYLYITKVPLQEDINNDISGRYVWFNYNEVGKQPRSDEVVYAYNSKYFDNISHVELEYSGHDYQNHEFIYIATDNNGHKFRVVVGHVPTSFKESDKDLYDEASEHLMDLLWDDVSAEVIDYYIYDFGSEFVITYNHNLRDIEKEAINLSSILTRNGYKVKDWNSIGNNILILKFAKPISLNEGIKDNESLDEASYGGAYDIEDDQYFTKEEIVDVAEKVCEHLDETYPDKFDVSDVYMETPTIIHVEVISKEGNWASANAKIDMRKIKKPSDIMKYDVVIGDLVYNLRQELEDLYKA